MEPQARPGRVALVVMPWLGVTAPPLGIAVLKSFLASRGVSVDCHYLNLRLYARVGGLFRRLADSPDTRLWAEWLFGYHLFGPGGTGELGEGVDQVLGEKSFREFLRISRLSEGQLRRLVLEEIPAFLEDCLADVPWSGYDLVGFSSNMSTLTACLKLAREIKARHPELPVVFGGANVQGEMGAAVLKGCPWVDYVVDGEGEEPLAALLEALRAGAPGRAIPGVRRRGAPPPAPGERVDLRRLPPPDHDQFFEELDRRGLREVVRPSVTFETSRGCWWGQKQHCTFCGIGEEALPFRAKDARQVVEEVVFLQRRHRCRDLYAADYILGMEQLRSLAPALERRRLEEGADWALFFEVKANLSRKDVESLAGAGVARVQAGIESLSTPILRLMRKGVRALQNLQTLKLGMENGIEVSWNLLWGFPGEDAAEYARMASLVPLLSHLEPPLSCGRIRVDRFSPYHADWESFGTRQPRPWGVYRFLFPRPRFKLEEIAYFFDLDDPRPGRAAPADLEALERAVAGWRARWPSTVFAFSAGCGYVDLYDSRPDAAPGAGGLTEARLEGLEAFVFLFCATIRGFGEIASACREKGFTESGEALRSLLDRMTRRAWLYREEESYLALAVPAARLRPAQKLFLERMIKLRQAAGLLQDKIAAEPVNSRR